MTRLGCRTQARRVFRQGNGIKPHLQHTPQYFSPICRCSGMCKTSLLDVETVRAQTNSGGSRGGNYPLTVTFSLSRDIETCQYPGGHHKYQSQRDDECNENPGIAHALFGLRQRATALLNLTGSPDRAGRRVANLLIDAHGNRTGIEIRHERKILKRRPCSGGEGQDIRMVGRTQSPLSPASTIRPRRTKGVPELVPGHLYAMINRHGNRFPFGAPGQSVRRRAKATRT